MIGDESEHVPMNAQAIIVNNDLKDLAGLRQSEKMCGKRGSALWQTEEPRIAK